MIILQDNHPPEKTAARDITRAGRLPLRRTGTLLSPTILLLSPLIVGITIAILLGLLGIFVAWLVVVSALVSAIVLSDVARRSLRVFARTHGNAFQHRAAGYS